MREREREGAKKRVVEAQPCCHACIMFTCEMLENIVEASGKFSTDFVMTKLFTREASEEIMFLRFYNPVVSPSHSCVIFLNMLDFNILNSHAEGGNGSC